MGCLSAAFGMNRHGSGQTVPQPPRPGPAPARVVDVAAVAGVSAQTVSNVINGRRGFNEATRAKVEEAIAELGFQPNRYAQSLRSKRTMQIGFDLTGAQLDLANPFTSEFLRSLVSVATAMNYRVLAFAHKTRSKDEFRHAMRVGIVDGFVLSDSQPGDVRADVLTELGIPFVTFGRTRPSAPQTWVDIDNAAAMHAVVDRLVAAGHRSFAYIGFPGKDYWNHERLQGVRERLAEHDLTLPASSVLLGRLDTLRPKIHRFLEQTKHPTAIVTSSDSIAVVAVTAATAMGLSVGRDVAVTGFDAGPLRTMVEPILTSVRIPLEKVAQALMERLVEELRGPTGRPGVIVATELVPGGSG